MRFALFFILYGIFWIALKSVFPIPGDFLLLAVVTLAFSEEEWWRGFLVALFLGFLLDTVSLSPFGVSLLSYAVVFLFIRFLRTKIMFQSPMARFYWIFFFMGVCEGVVLGLLQWGFVTRWAMGYFLPQALWQMVWTAFFGMFLPLRERQNA